MLLLFLDFAVRMSHLMTAMCPSLKCDLQILCCHVKCGYVCCVNFIVDHNCKNVPPDNSNVLSILTCGHYCLFLLDNQVRKWAATAQ